MTDETKVEEKDEQAETSNAAPALKKPVLLGRKLGMLQHFKDDGSVVAATIIVAEANVVTHVRTKERDGYSAIQLGFGRAKNPDRMTKAERGTSRTCRRCACSARSVSTTPTGSRPVRRSAST